MPMRKGVEIRTSVQRPRWLVQYRRMRRWRARIVAGEDDPDYELDNVHAFFIACFHLRDWIANDPEVRAEVRQAVRHFASDETSPLPICEHLANGLKHLYLHDPKLQKPVMLSTGKDMTVSIGDDVLGDAATIADRCIGAWDAFLKKHGLLLA